MARQTARQKQSKRINRTRAAKKRRRELRTFVWVGVGMVGLGLLGGGGWLLVDSGIVMRTAERAEQGFFAMTAHLGFALESITVEGRTKTTQDDILEAIGAEKGTPLLELSIADMQRRIEAINSVAEASVERVLPDRLSVFITERVPVAVWQSDGALRLVDKEGVVLADEAVKDYPDMLLVVGKEARAHLAELFALLKKEPALAKEVASAVWVGNRRWDVHFKNGLKVMLPEEAPEHAWRRVAAMAQEEKILEKAVTAIDMRLKERVFIKTMPRPKQEESKPAAET